VSLERLMEVEIEILVEGHGHIHTLRSDIPDFSGVVIRQDPKVAISEKLDYLRWLKEQIEAGFQEGLPVRVHRGKLFPMGTPYFMGELCHRRVHSASQSRSLFSH
jgi:hypothetical protein